MKIRQINIVIDCCDAGVLAQFYSKLLGWEWTHPHANGWAAITSPTGTVIAFQEIEGYAPPVWPYKKDEQGQMIHLDFMVENLDKAVQHAITCGAKVANVQYFETSTTLIDPAGHPFCLDTYENE